jgi:hypothetical protein
MIGLAKKRPHTRGIVSGQRFTGRVNSPRAQFRHQSIQYLANTPQPSAVTGACGANGAAGALFLPAHSPSELVGHEGN